MTSAPLTAVVASAIALATALLVRPVLNRLPEPADGEGKPLYRDLASPDFVVACGLLAGLGAAVSWIFLPPAVQPLWAVLAVIGTLLAAVDARTTWLPLRLTRIGWLAMAAATAALPLAGGDTTAILRALGGAGIAGALYLVVWFSSQGGFGFGDVRFAPLIGAPAAAHSWGLLFWTLMLGSLVGGVMALIRLIRGKRGSFPYAPPMLAGAYAAALTLWFTQRL